MKRLIRLIVVTIIATMVLTRPALAFFHSKTPKCDASAVKEFVSQSIKDSYFDNSLNIITREANSLNVEITEVGEQLKNPITLEKRKAEMDRIYNEQLGILRKFGNSQSKGKSFPANRSLSFYDHYIDGLSHNSAPWAFNNAFEDSDWAKLASMNKKFGLPADNIDSELYEKVRNQKLWGEYGYKDEKDVKKHFLKLGNQYKYFKKLNPVVHNRELAERAPGLIRRGLLLTATGEYLKNGELLLSQIAETESLLTELGYQEEHRACAARLQFVHTGRIQLCSSNEAERCFGLPQFTPNVIRHQQKSIQYYTFSESSSDGSVRVSQAIDNNPYGIGRDGIAKPLHKYLNGE